MWPTNFRPYQVRALNDLEAILKTSRKACVAVSCGGGKTALAIGFTNKAVTDNHDCKVLILAHGQTILRKQFNDDCNDYESKIEPLSGDFRRVVIDSSNIRDLNKLYASHNVFIAIPQTFNGVKDLPQFDIVIIDEGHQFYFTKEEDGMVQRLIRKCKSKKEICFTGTPAPFILKKWPIITVTMGELFDSGYVQDLVVELASSSYLVDDIEYSEKNGELKQSVQAKAFTKENTGKTLDDLLSFIYKRSRVIWRDMPNLAAKAMHLPSWAVAFKRLDKTMIACKSQAQAHYVKEYFEKCGIKTLLSISNDSDASESNKVFDDFKADKETLVLIVVNRGILGFNFPDLINVIDMTCSKNINRIFQLMSRAVRKSETGKSKLFLKIAPQIRGNLRGNDYFRHIMTAVMSLTQEYWFKNFNGKNFLQLRVPFAKKPKQVNYTDNKEQKSNDLNDLVNTLECFDGLPMLEFFKSIPYKDEDNSSYAYTTLGQVRDMVLGMRDPNGEPAARERCKQVIDFRIKEGRWPSRRSKDENEKRLSTWYSDMKKAKKGLGRRAFYPFLQKTAEDTGFPDMFDNVDLEAKAKDKCQHAMDFRIKEGRWPKSNSKDGHWLVGIRKAKKGLEGRAFYPSLQKMAEDAGFPDMFDKQK